MKYYKGKPLIFTNPHDEMVYEAGEIAALAELRVKVEALAPGVKWDPYQDGNPDVVLRADVLALIDGNSDGA